ncbi:DNA-binding proteins Bright/BRCAA1/RBP1 and proteins containing BRIGHT domain, partial [Collariella sp. IMI 366227]
LVSKQVDSQNCQHGNYGICCPRYRDDLRPRQLNCCSGPECPCDEPPDRPPDSPELHIALAAAPRAQGPAAEGAPRLDRFGPGSTLPEILLNHGPLPIRHLMGYPNSIPIIKTPGWSTERSRFDAPLGTSLGAFSAAFSHDDRDHDNLMDMDMDMDMMDHEADKMSLDGSGSASCSEVPDEDELRRNDDPEDATDDEDWAAVGAAALRASSYQARANQPHFPFGSVYTSGAARSYSAGMARPPQFRAPTYNLPASPLRVVASDAQEREAVEALLRLGSM